MVSKQNKTMKFVIYRGFRVASGIGLDTPQKEEKPQPLKTYEMSPGGSRSPSHL